MPPFNCNRRDALRSVSLLALGDLAVGAAEAQEAGRPIRFIVPFPPGGQTDVAARVIGQALGESLKTSVLIENKPGAHGLIGGTEAARAPGDGTTLLVGSTGFIAINPLLYEKMPYDTNRDLRPVSLLITVPIVLMVNTQLLPVQTVAELVAYLKANPGTVNYASAGNGGSSHLLAEYFKYRTGTTMTHVPYKGESPASASVVGGQVHLMFNTLVGTLPHLKSGKVRILAPTTRERLAEFPDIPTVGEGLGMPDFEASSWTALYAPASTPTDIVRRLSSEIDAALAKPAVAKRLKELGAVAVGGPPERMGELQRTEQEKWRRVIQAAGIKLE